jgi:hypothetical protein
VSLAIVLNTRLAEAMSFFRPIESAECRPEILELHAGNRHDFHLDPAPLALFGILDM